MSLIKIEILLSYKSRIIISSKWLGIRDNTTEEDKMFTIVGIVLISILISETTSFNNTILRTTSDSNNNLSVNATNRLITSHWNSSLSRVSQPNVNQSQAFVNNTDDLRTFGNSSVNSSVNWSVTRLATNESQSKNFSEFWLIVIIVIVSNFVTLSLNLYSKRWPQSASKI